MSSANPDASLAQAHREPDRQGRDRQGRKPRGRELRRRDSPGLHGRGRISSIARSISWGFWWRRLVGFISLDVVLLAVALALVLHGYNRALPEGSFVDWYRPAPGTTVRVGGPSSIPGDLRGVTYVVTSPSGGERSFPLGADMLDGWPLYVVVLVAQALSLLGGLDDTRRVRRSMAPLNDLALRAEELGNASVIDPSKMESLEQAIERATVESPRVVTGDQDLASIEVALNRLLRQMQEAKLQQMRFVNDASHELRTPIAVIQGYVNMLDRWGKSDGDVLDESISALKVESEHMQELVEQLLFLARGDSGRNSLRKAPANLARIAVEVWEESAMIDAGHAYRLMFDEGLAHDGRFATTGDVALLKQAVRIVVQNAAKYSDAGTPISFDVGSDTHGIGDDRGGGGSVWVSVADEGVGMSPGAADHVFERFYRADNARERGTQGSGLGLSIAKWIVDSHGGSIELLSREGVGSRFTLRVPRAAG